MSGRNQAGFTLLEALVGVALLAIIAGLLAGALRLGLASARSVEARVAALEETRSAQLFLRRHIEGAVPLIVNDEARGEIAFHGDGSRLDFVAEMYGRDGMKGLWYVRLTSGRTDAGERLILLRQPITRAREPFDFLPDAESSVILRSRHPLSIAYHDGVRWLGSWPRAEQLPRLVRIRIGSGAETDWPDLVAAPRLDPAQP